MPVQTFNALAVAPGKWTPAAATYSGGGQPWRALDIYVHNTDVVCQISEDANHIMPTADDSDILLRVGFHSRPLPPFSAVQFKVWSGSLVQTGGIIDVTLRT
jgi:hypothetical protein